MSESGEYTLQNVRNETLCASERAGMARVLRADSIESLIEEHQSNVFWNCGLEKEAKSQRDAAINRQSHPKSTYTTSINETNEPSSLVSREEPSALQMYSNMKENTATQQIAVYHYTLRRH